MEKIQKKLPDISAFGLHVLAMTLMLGDHIWATLPHISTWFTAMGRIAFPIFAFLMAEGHAHTADIKKYRLRLLLLAVVTEVPFNLMCCGRVFYPIHQNVIWTFLLASVCIGVIDKAWEKKTVPAALAAAGVTWLCYLAGYVLFVDYHGEGVLTVVMFYLLRGSRWWNGLGQLGCLYWINVEMLKGRIVSGAIFGVVLKLPLQAFALLALIPIWLYRGRQGPHSKAVKLINYGFYPVHMLVLWLIAVAL